MNLGKNILELRKQRHVTQEDLAAELGVTAAAVSKWENGYTLPDILMLCALADYFQTTTDELLGRSAKWTPAVVAANRLELGQKIAQLIQRYGFRATHIFPDYTQALAFIQEDKSVRHLFISFDKPMQEQEREDLPKGLFSVESHAETEQQVLDGFEVYLRNATNFDEIAKAKTAGTAVK